MNTSVHDMNRRRRGTASEWATLRVLDALDETPAVTQREISRRVGISLGLTNLLLRRMARKAWIKLRTVPGRRMLYALTPKGLKEKARKSFDFVRLSYRYYVETRASLVEALRRSPMPRPRVGWYGADGLEPLLQEAVREAGGKPLGAVSSDESPRGNCDVLVLFEAPPRALRDRFEKAGAWVLERI